MKSTLNNQLAQLCNNLHRTIRQVTIYRFKFVADNKLNDVCDELQAEYNTLFKLIYGDK